jgi:hypothetical protein
MIEEIGEADWNFPKVDTDFRRKNVNTAHVGNDADITSRRRKWDVLRMMTAATA